MPNQVMAQSENNIDQPSQQADLVLEKINLEKSGQTVDKSSASFWHRHKKVMMWISSVAVVFISLLTALGFYTFSIIQQLKTQGQEIQVTAQAAYTNFKNQNLPATEAELKKVDSQEQELRQTYQKLGFYSYIPWIRRYYQDGLHTFSAGEAALRAGLKSVEAITPYADVLGFAGKGTFEGSTAEDRLAVVLQTLDKISPILDEISDELSTAQSELAQINPQRYPQNLGGTDVRSYVIQAQQSSQVATDTVTQYRPVLEQLPSIMGAQGERKKYLVLFQNDNELRPTGGFMTAYATIFLEDGKVTPEKSDDIYELDKRFYERIPIPEELGRYLTTEKYWNLRDMNIYPDFKTSMEQFLEYYLEIRGEPSDIDGVIAVDTNVLTKLLQVLGPIEVPGYGTFSAEEDSRCDCPQVVYALSEIITKPTPYHRENRKGILGPMMRSILTKVYGAPKQQWPQLFEIGIESLESRHTQLYFLDEIAQQAGEAINVAGRMTLEPAADFIAIVNTNLSGAKTNLFINYQVKQTVTAPEDGRLEKSVDITYRNPSPADNCNLEAGQLCLNSTHKDWTRIYLPTGSKLLSAQGFTQEAKQYQVGEFQIVDSFFILEPEGQAKIKLTYTVPYQDTKKYRLKIWKQGGIDPFETVIDVAGGQEQLMIDQDVIYETPF